MSERAGVEARARPRLGVGVCAWNEAEALPRLLTRLLGPPPAPGSPSASTHPNADDLADRVVVADGGSRDGTPALARAAGAEVLTTGRGRGVQLAAAAEALLAPGAMVDVLVFLHADALPAPGAIAALRDHFAAGAEAAGFHQTVDAPGRLMRGVERAADARVRRGMVYGDSGLAVRADAYRRSGGYAPLPLFEDVALSHALRRAGVRVGLAPGARLTISARRWRREGVLRCTLRNWILRGLYEAGVSPTRLARLYRPHSNP